MPETGELPEGTFHIPVNFPEAADPFVPDMIQWQSSPIIRARLSKRELEHASGFQTGYCQRKAADQRLFGHNGNLRIKRIKLKITNLIS